jgi:hypothetical protein
VLDALHEGLQDDAKRIIKLVCYKSTWGGTKIIMYIEYEVLESLSEGRKDIHLGDEYLKVENEIRKACFNGSSGFVEGTWSFFLRA